MFGVSSPLGKKIRPIAVNPRGGQMGGVDLMWPRTRDGRASATLKESLASGPPRPYRGRLEVFAEAWPMDDWAGSL